MTAIKELYLASLFILFSQISGQQSGNATINHCGSSNLNIVFNFSLGGEHFYYRSWYLNSTANKIATANSTGFLTVEPPYSSRVTLSGTNGITLSHVNSSDSGTYLFVIITDVNIKLLTATTTVIINEIPNNSCIPITKNYINSINCKIPAACPGKDSIEARWNDGSISLLRCPLASRKYTCCAIGDPVTNCYSGSLCTEAECKDATDPGSIRLSPNRTSHELAESSSLTVNCSADCFPDCQYRWTGSGGSNVSSTSLLSINYIGRNQTGKYTCTASDPENPNIKATAAINVTVFYGPDERNVSLSPSNTSYQLTEWSRLDVNCSATCVPQCNYQWSGPLVSHNYSVGFLSISQISRDQHGTFICTVTNPKVLGKSATANFSVIVCYGPDIPHLSPSTTVYTKVEGESLPDINCSADCFPGCTQVWMKGVASVQASDGKTLSLRQVTREKAGEYTCWLNNTESRATGNISIKLIVQYPPVLTMMATNTSKGGRVVISCTAFGVPDNYTFSKYIHIAPDERKTIVRELETARVSSSDVSFTIEGATYQDNGFYLCKASNGIKHYSTGQLIMDDMVSVWIADQAVITSNTRDFDAEKGKSGQMYIEFYSGIPQPLVTWYIDNNGTKELLQNSSNFGIYLSTVTVEVKYYQKIIRLPGYNASLEVYDVADAQFTSYNVEINNSWAEPIFETLQLKPRVMKDEPGNPNGSPVTIGAATGSALVLVIAVAIVGFLFYKRRQSIKSSEEDVDVLQGEKSKSDRHKSGLVDNPVYDSSGPLPDPPTSGSAAGVEYAAVVKPKKKGGQVKDLSNLYAQVDKTQNGKKKGDIYENATLAGRDNLKGKTYENSGELKADENSYENPSEKAHKESLAKNDGLLYADLALNSPTTKNGKYVIRGLENRTEYAEIAYGKRGEPLPDNEKEN